MKAIVNVQLYDYETYLQNAFVVFDREILAVGSMEDFHDQWDEAEIMDGQGLFLLPGLINFHTHMYSAFARGFDFKSQPATFTQNLEEIWWKLDGALTLEDCYWSAMVHGRELLLKGVVGLVDHHASGAIAGSTAAVEKAMKDLGLHGLTCFETSDRFDLEGAVSENVEMIKRTGGPFGLHASMTLSDKTLDAVKAAVKDQPIHCHVSESVDDQNYHTATPVERLDQAGLINPFSILAHCIHVTESDAETIAKRQAIVALNPRSNQNNGVGEFDYSLFQKHKIPIVAGTDGLGADVAKSWQNIYYITKASEKNRTRMSLEDIRRHLAETYVFYNKLSGRSLGRFQAGYRFDAILIDYKAFTPVSEANVFAHVFFGIFDDLRVKKLWNGGSLLVDGYEAVHSFDLPDHLVKDLWKRIEVKE